MAPSIAQIPESAETTSTTVPVKAVPVTETKPKVRRGIDEEGGKTTALVSIKCRVKEE
jgi:hypothetical protein